MARRKRKPATPIVCPYCSDDSFKSLAKGARTRCCGKKVVRINGHAYKSKEESPEWQIIVAFVEHKRGAGLKLYEIPFRSSAYREALTAASILLDKCAGDTELAFKVIDVSFNHPRHKWRDHLGLFSVISGKYLPDALAVAKLELETDRRERKLDQYLSTSTVLATEAPVSIW